MALDATYDHLLRLLANRGLGWLREQIQALPPRLAPNHPAVPPLSMAARLAPVLSGLRGTASPLESIVAQRFDAVLAARVTAALWRKDADSDRLAPLLAGAGPVAHQQPLWQLARQYLATRPLRDLAERLELARSLDPAQPDAALIAETEAFLSRPVSELELTHFHIDLFYRVLTGLYHFGAERPRILSPRIFGKAFDNCLHFLKWAQANNNLTAIAQVATCLRLIDPDHDMGEILADVIPYQRPDGSFPPRCGWSDQPQDLASGALPTLVVVGALHLITYRRWQARLPQLAQPQPIHACCDQVAARVIQRLPEVRALPLSQRLFAAASISRATGRDGFRMLGLQGHAPGRADMQELAWQLASFPEAARHAQQTLSMDAPLREMLAQQAQGPQAGGDPRPATAALSVEQVAQEADERDFLHALQLQAGEIGPHSHARALRLAQREFRAFLARPRASITELLGRLSRLSLMARLCEPHDDLPLSSGQVA